MCLDNVSVKTEKLDYMNSPCWNYKMFISLLYCLVHVCVAGVFEVNCSYLL